MSYDKDIDNYTVKFKDEESYLNCRLDYLEYLKEWPHAATSFLSFIWQEIYDGGKCEVESWEPIQHAEPLSNVVDTTTINNIPTFTASNPYIIGVDNGVDTGDFHIDGNLYVSGNIIVGTATGDFSSNTTTVYNQPIHFKDEEPEDPIDSRFDIIDY